MATFLVSVGIGLATAAILSLSAVAFTLEYAVSKIANFAHGELLTIGAYAAYSGQAIFHQNVAAAALIATAAGTLAGLALNAGLIERFRGRSGITASCSSVPVCRSRTTPRLVMIVPMKTRITPHSPGIMMYEVFSSGL